MDDYGFQYCKIPREAKELWDLFTRWYFRIFGIALSSFRWKLPPTCSQRELEKCLFYYGNGLIFRDELSQHWFTLPFVQGGRLNMYEIPTIREAFSSTGYNQRCTAENSIVVYSNYSHYPDCLAAVQYAEQLAQIDMSIRVNADAQKTPYIIKGNKRQEKTLREFFRKIMRNERAIYTDNDLDPESISVLRTEAPQSFLPLQELKDRTWNECLNYFGVQGGNMWKKERLVSQEVSMPQGQTVMERANRLDCRREACEMANARWGIGLAVEYNGNVEGDIYGSLHDDNRGNVPDSGQS